MIAGLSSKGFWIVEIGPAGVSEFLSCRIIASKSQIKGFCKIIVF